MRERFSKYHNGIKFGFVLAGTVAIGLYELLHPVTESTTFKGGALPTPIDTSTPISRVLEYSASFSRADLGKSLFFSPVLLPGCPIGSMSWRIEYNMPPQGVGFWPSSGILLKDQKRNFIETKLYINKNKPNGTYPGSANLECLEDGRSADKTPITYDVVIKP